MVNRVGKCSIEGCEKVGPLTKTWCTRHYARHLRRGRLGPPGLMRAPNSPEPWELVKYHGYEEKESGCWEASGFQNEDGYIIWSARGGKTGAHRESYRAFKGDIPAGMSVMHSCDNPPCINPEHLSLGTHSDNMRDSLLKGRSNTAKLLPGDVRTVRRYIEEGRTDESIAEEFGMTRYNVALIRKGINWHWLE